MMTTSKFDLVKFVQGQCPPLSALHYIKCVYVSLYDKRYALLRGYYEIDDQREESGRQTMKVARHSPTSIGY